MPKQGRSGRGRRAVMARAISHSNASLSRGDVLRALDEAARLGDDVEALRQADRAQRILPPNADILRINARLLGRQGEEEAALNCLVKASRSSPSGEIDAEIIEAMLALNRFPEAERYLTDALQKYAVAGYTDPLARAARRIISDPRAGSTGWIALSPDLELIGEMRSQVGRLKVTTIGGLALQQPRLTKPDKEVRERAGNADAQAFAIPLKGLPVLGPIVAEIDGTPLLGSGLAYPPDFALDGRTQAKGRRLTGWVQLGWAPSHPPELMIEDERGGRWSAKSQPSAANSQRHQFELDLAVAGLRGSRITVSARLPDGRLEALPDAPLLLARAVPAVGNADAPPAGDGPSRAPAALPDPAPTAIVVPVYRGREETIACLESVLATVDAKSRLVVVNDGSPEPDLTRALESFAAKGAIDLLRNDQNQGFPAAVNRALAHCAGYDVVLLNADAAVSGDWLARLRRAAYSAPDISTVTPFSNTGSIASYPTEGNTQTEADSAISIDKLTAVVDAGVTVEIPTGVGFCLYIRADCLAATGSFDAATFGAGYGEENDFCLRARRRG